MPGLNPLQNAKPRQQIPNEAPQYFSPFFEQPAKPPPVSIWQPPSVELPRRSKAPTHRPRSPPQIPTAGAWTKKAPVEEQPQNKGLFQPKQKKSLDEMMWLGSVAGFSLPEPAPPKEERSLRSKLVRKPEQLPSQASSATGPRAVEANRRKEEEAKAREKRLEEWATKKKPHASEKQVKRHDGPAPIPLPQPIESRLRSRMKVYTPLPQAEEAARISNRPNAVHRPHMPSHGDGSYAPENPFLPQPIETVRRSNRPRQLPKKVKSQEEETLWMGLPQPVETTRRSNRKSPLNKMEPTDEYDIRQNESDKDSVRHLFNDRSQCSKGATDHLPQPIETSRRSNRSADNKKGVSPQPIEITRKSNRPAKEILPETIEPIPQPNYPEKKDALLPQLIETSRRSNRSTGQKLLPQSIETARHSNHLAEKEELPVPVETTKRSNRPSPTPVQTRQPPTPTTSFFGPEILPQQIETSSRSHRPITARPLVPQLVEQSMRSSRMRIPPSGMHLELPQPVSVSRWTGRALGQRRESTSSNPMSPGVFSSSRNGNKNRRQVKKYPGPAADHVWHLHEPIDSTPVSPVGTPDGSPDASPSMSKCPSLSSSPTSSAASTSWDTPVKSTKSWGVQGRRESLEDGFSVCGLERKLKEEKPVSEDWKKEGAEYPFPLTEEVDTNYEPKFERIGLGIRSESSETIRPSFHAIETESTLSIQITREPSEANDYPICHSPKFENFRRPLLTKFVAVETTNGLEMWHPPGSVAAPSTGTPSTPPEPLSSSLSSKLGVPDITHGPTTTPPRVWPVGPSPGYTVASLPPAKRKENTAKEVTPEFIDEVYRYLSLQFENVAGKFDEELATYTGVCITVVKGNRKAALAVYCEKWIQEHPDIETGEGRKGGLW